mgnify:FL=1
MKDDAEPQFCILKKKQHRQDSNREKKEIPLLPYELLRAIHPTKTKNRSIKNVGEKSITPKALLFIFADAGLVTSFFNIFIHKLNYKL